MSFKRNDIQKFIEYELGCSNTTNWTSYKQSLLNWKVNYTNFERLKNCSKSDLQSYFFKALETFIQALHEINQGKYAWSIVKLYYSSFYLLRCDILLSSFMIVRCGAMYYSKIKVGEKFIPYNKKKIRGDHQLTISLAQKLFNDGAIIDPLFGNDIDGQNVYLWLMKNRERVNYQMKDFPDPYADRSLSHIDSYFKGHKVSELLDFYNKNQDYSVCFDIDHSMVAIPFKKLIGLFKRIKSSLDYNDFYKRKLVKNLNLLLDLNINKLDINNLIK